MKKGTVVAPTDAAGGPYDLALLASLRDYAVFSITGNGVVTAWGTGATQVLGHAETRIVGRNYAALFDAEDRRAATPRALLREAQAHGHADLERWFVRDDGSRFFASGKIRELPRTNGDAVSRFVVVARDETGRHAATEALRQMALYDELTGLPNRRSFLDALRRAIGARERSANNGFALLFVDVDHFKRINDEFGHVAADRLLNVLARRFERCVRAGDLVARIGGDEFAMLVSVEGVADACDAAARIGVETCRPVRIDGADLRATVSIGFALADARDDRPESILRGADCAMYAAKARGGACAVAFEPSMSDLSRTSPLNLLHAAAERGELRASFAPIVALASGRVTGFASRVRWQHPQRGLLEPRDFVPEAERSDAIFGIDRWTLEHGCRQMAAWLAAGADARMQLSVGISSREFGRDAFHDDLSALLDLTGLPPRNLRLTIAKAACAERRAGAEKLVARVRRLGVAVDVEGFGNGGPPLGAIRDFTVDGLAIDGELVGDLDAGPTRALVESIVFLAHRLGVATVAQGVATAEQARSLRAMGCDFGHGSFASAPLDAAAAGHLALAQTGVTPRFLARVDVGSGGGLAAGDS